MNMRASEALAYLALDKKPRKYPTFEDEQPVYPGFTHIDLPNPQLEQRRKELARKRRFV